MAMTCAASARRWSRRSTQHRPQQRQIRAGEGGKALPGSRAWPILHQRVATRSIFLGLAPHHGRHERLLEIRARLDDVFRQPRRAVRRGPERQALVVPVSRTSHEKHHPAVVAADAFQPCLGDARHAPRALQRSSPCCFREMRIAGLETDRLPDRSLSDAAETVDLDEVQSAAARPGATSTAARQSAARTTMPSRRPGWPSASTPRGRAAGCSRRSGARPRHHRANRPRGDFNRCGAGGELLCQSFRRHGQELAERRECRRIRAAVEEHRRTGHGSSRLALVAGLHELSDRSHVVVRHDLASGRTRRVNSPACRNSTWRSTSRIGIRPPAQRQPRLVLPIAWRSCQACSTDRGGPTLLSPPSTTSDWKSCCHARPATTAGHSRRCFE